MSQPEWIKLQELLKATGLVEQLTQQIKDRMLQAKNPEEWLELKIAHNLIQRAETHINNQAQGMNVARTTDRTDS